MTSKKSTQPQQESPTRLLTQQGVVWVITGTDRENRTASLAIRGLYVKPLSGGGLAVTPIYLGDRNVPTYTVYDYAKSTNDNAGRISFSSNGTKFEVRALTLADADWLFPGQDFLTLKQLTDAVIQG